VQKSILTEGFCAKITNAVGVSHIFPLKFLGVFTRQLPQGMTSYFLLVIVFLVRNMPQTVSFFLVFSREQKISRCSTNL